MIVVECGYVMVCNMFVCCFEYGWGGLVDLVVVVVYYWIVVQVGFDWVCYNLVNFYVIGCGVFQDQLCVYVLYW